MTDLVAVDGRSVSRTHEESADVVVVGSGPAGAAAARSIARAGLSVVVIEEGPSVRTEDVPEDSFSAMAHLYRDLGASLLLGRAPMPFVQGRLLGGTSVVNGAISWRMPRDVLDGWAREDPAIAGALPWERIEAVTDDIEADLHIAATDPAIAGRKNLLMARGAEAMGIEHRPIFRNVRDCQGLGRCLQGCPAGRKMSMEKTYLPDAVASGARIVTSATVTQVTVSRGVARGVVGRTAGGGLLRASARRAVVLAASAVQTPILLWRSGLRRGPVGRGFQCHPGVSMAGRFAEPVRAWLGATQGHEVIGLRHEGLKLEALGYDMTIVAMRLKGIGRDFSRGVADLAHWVNWGAAIRASARGRVLPGPGGRAVVLFDLTRDDVRTLRRGVRVLGEMMLAAGADHVTPGVAGWHERVSDRATMARFEDEGPWDPRAYACAVTHMFGTCRMGSDPETSVVGLDFRHHDVDRLYVADSSVFPGNTGVNPQTSILALATICARGIAS